MNTSESLLFSSSFVVSCGTVTIDTKASRVLLIYLRNNDEYLLPKGRVNIGEDWRQAACRETFEETGVRVQLLPISVTTRATPSAQMAPVSNPTHTEPFAKTQRLVEGDVEKAIYWFAATADSTILPAKEEPQPGEEDFETCWLSYEDALHLVTFATERQMVQKIIELAHPQLIVSKQ